MMLPSTKNQVHSSATTLTPDRSSPRPERAETRYTQPQTPYPKTTDDYRRPPEACLQSIWPTGTVPSSETSRVRPRHSKSCFSLPTRGHSDDPLPTGAIHTPLLANTDDLRGQPPMTSSSRTEDRQITFQTPQRPDKILPARTGQRRPSPTEVNTASLSPERRNIPGHGADNTTSPIPGQTSSRPFTPRDRGRQPRRRPAGGQCNQPEGHGQHARSPRKDRLWL